MTRVSISFPIGDKTVTVARQSDPEGGVRRTIEQLLGEIEGSGFSDQVAPEPGTHPGAISGKATAGQLRALWGKALAKGWDREKVKQFLQEKLGTNQEKSIVGEIDRTLLSRLISEVENAG